MSDLSPPTEPTPPAAPTVSLTAPTAFLPPQYGPPPVAPPPRRRGRRALIVFGVVLLAILVSGGATYALVQARRLTPSAASTGAPSTVVTTAAATTAAPTPTASSFQGSLDDLILAMPADGLDWKPDVLQAGMTDVVRSATLWNPTKPQEIVDLLKGSGFERDAVRFWQDPAGNVVMIDLMQFGTTTGMYDWLRWSGNGLSNGNAAGTGTIKAVDNGKWAEFVVANDTHALALVFGKGPFGVVMRLNSPAAANVDLLTTVAVQQYGRLP